MQSVAYFFWKPASDYFFDAASWAHCQNFSADGLSFPLSATMPIENGFGSGVRCKNFTWLPKLQCHNGSQLITKPCVSGFVRESRMPCHEVRKSFDLARRFHHAKTS